jgi:hypothetical protein
MLSDDRITDKLVGEERDLIEVLSQIFPGRTEENHKNLNPDSVPAGIRNERFSTTSAEYYQYSNLFGVSILNCFMLF